MVGLSVCVGTSFCIEPTEKNIRMLSKSTNLAEKHRMQKHVHPTAI